MDIRLLCWHIDAVTLMLIHSVLLQSDLILTQMGDARIEDDARWVVYLASLQTLGAVLCCVVGHDTLEVHVQRVTRGHDVLVVHHLHEGLCAAKPVISRVITGTPPAQDHNSCC